MQNRTQQNQTLQKKEKAEKPASPLQTFPGISASTERNNSLPQSKWQQYAGAFAVFVLVSLLNFGLQKWIGYQAIALVYLLAVVLLSLFVSRGPILFGTALTALAWKRTAEQERERRTSALYLLTRELAEGTDRADLLGKIIRQVGTVFNADVFLLLPNPNGRSRLTACVESTWLPNENEMGIANWVYQNNQPAGRGTETLPEAAKGFHLPLGAGATPAGVMGLRLKSAGDPNLPQRELLQSFARET